MTPIVEKIATSLGETDQVPLKTIDRMVNVLGEERVLALFEETLKIEAEGGLKTDDGLRQRSPGGVFFKLAKDKTTPRERGRIFGPPPKPKTKAAANSNLGRFRAAAGRFINRTEGSSDKSEADPDW